jgi:hypothetical protein
LALHFFDISAICHGYVENVDLGCIHSTSSMAGLSKHPKFSGIGEVEIVGDPVAETVPFSGLFARGRSKRRL